MINIDQLLAVTSSPLHTGVALLAFIIIWKVSEAAYRLQFHPLASFPSPREAALSTNWIYKLSKSGKVVQELERLHQLFWTHAVRIAPNGLHLSDTSKYKTIYSQSRPFPKQEEFYKGFGTPHTVFVESDQILHKERRRLLKPFFAKAGVLKIEPAIHSHVRNLRAKLTKLSATGKSIVAQNAFRCVTVDIVTDFAFAESRHLVDNSDESFSAPFLDTFDALSDILWDSIYSPRIREFGTLLPKKLVAKFNAPLRHIFALADEASASLAAYHASSAKYDKPVIFESLKDLPDDLIAAEAVDILVAGSDTTAFTLDSGVWHLCHNPAIKRKLVVALKDAFPDASEALPTLLQLEVVPYLVACMEESLRIAMPVQGRLPRVVPQNPSTPLIVDDKGVPPGTTVGMSAYTMHFDEQLWGPDAKIFNPDRWLGESSKGLDAYLATFSKGARSCIGQNLAQTEVLVVLYMLFRNFEVDLALNLRRNSMRAMFLRRQLTSQACCCNSQGWSSVALGQLAQKERISICGWLSKAGYPASDGVVHSETCKFSRMMKHKFVGTNKSPLKCVYELDMVALAT